MKRHVVMAAVVIAMVWSASVHAADPSGRWSATFMTDVGEQSYTYEFIVMGTTLTGTAKGSLTGEDQRRHDRRRHHYVRRERHL